MVESTVLHYYVVLTCHLYNIIVGAVSKRGGDKWVSLPQALFL